MMNTAKQKLTRKMSLRFYLQALLVLLAALLIPSLSTKMFYATTSWQTSRMITQAKSDVMFLEAFLPNQSFALLVEPGRLAAPIEYADKLLELFKIDEATSFATLAHTDHRVRLYAAMHLLRLYPEEASLLRPLLRDLTAVEWRDINQTKAPLTTTVGRLTADMMCAMSVSNPHLAQLTRNLSSDWFIGSVRMRLRQC